MKAIAYCRNPEKKGQLAAWGLTPEQVEEIKEPPRMELMLHNVAREAEELFKKKFKLPVLILLTMPEKEIADQPKERA